MYTDFKLWLFQEKLIDPNHLAIFYLSTKSWTNLAILHKYVRVCVCARARVYVSVCVCVC